jgi:hypothetical protein
MSQQLDSSAPIGADRRADPRANVIWRGRVDVDPPRSIDVRVINISKFGVGALTNELLLIGASYDLELEIPSPLDCDNLTSVKMRCRVVSTTKLNKGYRIGANIFNIEYDAHDLMMYWINSRGVDSV